MARPILKRILTYREVLPRPIAEKSPYEFATTAAQAVRKASAKTHNTFTYNAVNEDRMAYRWS